MMIFKSRARRLGAMTLMAVTTVALTACAGQSTPANRYTLPEIDATQTSGSTAPQARRLWVRPVEVASYLDQEGIVMQLSDIELNAANQNLWAEDLGQQLTRRLRQSLTADLPNVTLVGSDQDSPSAPRLTLNVEQFQGRYDGQAVASGEWQLHEDGRLLAQRHFDVTKPLQGDGYPALVRTLGDVWQSVAQQIATAIRTTLPEG